MAVVDARHSHQILSGQGFAHGTMAPLCHFLIWDLLFVTLMVWSEVWVPWIWNGQLYMQSHDLVAGDHMTIQVPQCSCCPDTKMTIRVSSCLNIYACGVVGFGLVGTLEETATLSGSSCLATPVTVWTVTCRIVSIWVSGSPLSLKCEAPESWMCDQDGRICLWYCRGTDPRGLG